ncbi:hypothetical protein FVR03_06045 [Pontibacter qinzhouensis]|uniref:TerB family tellurite resistance protein n=1 Tax=Pontibacter qinzhouensis TaxID=2603253 RepID=A0A5C8KD15_9BACT|nr:hypothetical protein [Pontibacter qinzhouensis]TXK49651.1 hypothetical protein FVR03_06045 [Pontibacter qinzhouensis]
MSTSTTYDNLLNSKQKKLAFFQNIVLVAIADGFVDEQESDFLISLGDQLQLSEEDTLPITDNLSVLTFIIPEDGMQKTVELQTLVMMMLQDGDLAESEYNLCLEYTRRIGYSKDILDDMIKSLSSKAAD